MHSILVFVVYAITLPPFAAQERDLSGQWNGQLEAKHEGETVSCSVELLLAQEGKKVIGKAILTIARERHEGEVSAFIVGDQLIIDVKDLLSCRLEISKSRLKGPCSRFFWIQVQDDSGALVLDVVPASSSIRSPGLSASGAISRRDMPDRAEKPLSSETTRSASQLLEEWLESRSLSTYLELVKRGSTTYTFRRKGESEPEYFGYLVEHFHAFSKNCLGELRVFKDRIEYEVVHGAKDNFIVGGDEVKNAKKTSFPPGFRLELKSGKVYQFLTRDGEAITKAVGNNQFSR